MFLSKQRTGIYINETGFFAVKASRDLNKIRILGSSSLLFSQVGAADAFSLLQQQFAKDGIGTGEPVTFCLKGDQTFLKFFELPAIFKAKEMNDVIRFEARKNTPFAMNELECGFQVLQTSQGPQVPGQKSPKKNQVFFSGVRRTILNFSIQPVIATNLGMDSVEPQALSLARLTLFTKGKTPDGALHLVIYKDSTGSANIVVAGKGYAMVSRYGVFGEDTAQFLSELRLTMDYFVRMFKGDKIQHVLSCLGPSDTSLSDIISKEMDLPVTPVLDLPIFSRKAPMSPELLCAAGSALRGLSFSEKVTVNFYRSRLADQPLEGEADFEKKRNFKEKIIRMVAFQAAAVLCVFVLIYMVLSMPVNTLEKQARVLRQKTDALGITVGENVQDMSATEQRYTQKLSAFASVEKERVSLTEKMNELVKLVSEGMWLGGAHYSEEKDREGKMTRVFEIEGWVLSANEGQGLESINRFASAISENKTLMAGFDEVKILTIQQETNVPTPVSRFSLVCRSAGMRRAR